MNKLLRKLNATEMISWIISQHFPHNLVVVANVKGDINLKNIETVLKNLQKNNLMLRVNTKIDEDSVFLTEITEQIPFHIYKREEAENWQHIVDQELRAIFLRENNPLARIIINYNEEGADIIFSFHHMIADGLAGIWFIRDFLNAISKPAKKILSNRLDLACEYIDWFPTCKLEKLKHDDENVTEFIHFKLDQQQTQKLVQYCKKNKINVHSALGSAASLALYHTMQKAETELRFSAPVNLRSLYHIKAENFSALSSWIDDKFNIKANFSTLNLAKQIFINTQTKINDQEPQKNVQDLYKFLNHKSINEIYNLVTTTLPTVIMSNLGRLSIESKYDSIFLTGIHIIANCQHYLDTDNAFLLIVTNLNETNFFNLCYSKKNVGKQKAEKFVASLRNVINEDFI